MPEPRDGAGHRDQQDTREFERKETVMAAKNKVTVSVQPTTQRLSSAQRRAAQMATLSISQAELKREAAERRAKRALNSNAPAASMPRKSATARRSTAR
jgi:hypothetical protein